MLGYKRKTGRPGIRNLAEVVFTVECASHVAKSIAAAFETDKVQYFGFSGCYPSEYGFNLVKGMCTNPNVGAVLIVSLGCENFDNKGLQEAVLASGRMCQILTIQESCGTASSIQKGKTIIEGMLKELEQTPRVELELADLCVGTICGGSDGTSVITGNPAVGRAFDELISHGACCIFEESGELIGCVELMKKRAVNEEVAKEIDEEMQKCRAYYDTLGLGSFSNGNAVGGLTTQEEKSLGAYAKSGGSQISGVILPGQVVPKGGLYLMDVIPDGEVRFGFPNICDNSEACELISCGCHLILFTTGRGNDIGSVVSPVVKICNNPQTYKNMEGDMDINAGKIIEGTAGLDDIKDEIIALIQRMGDGEKTKSEALGHVEYVLTYKAYDYQKIPSCLRA